MGDPGYETGPDGWVCAYNPGGIRGSGGVACGDAYVYRGPIAEEIAALYGPQATETGQAFAPDAVAYQGSDGHPCVVNAVARRCVDLHAVGPPKPILPEHIDAVTAERSASALRPWARSSRAR